MTSIVPCAASVPPPRARGNGVLADALTHDHTLWLDRRERQAGRPHPPRWTQALRRFVVRLQFGPVATAPGEVRR